MYDAMACYIVQITVKSALSNFKPDKSKLPTVNAVDQSKPYSLLVRITITVVFNNSDDWMHSISHHWRA